MYTNRKRGVIELGGEDDGNGNVAEDGDEDTTPTHARESYWKLKCRFLLGGSHRAA
jgi:hypothetical protein